MYKLGGKEGCRLLFRIYSTPDFIPRNTLRSAFGPYREKAASRYRNGWVAFGERLEVFRETVGIPLYEPGKGWLPVGKRVHPGTERGTAAGVCLFLIHLKSAGIGESRS